MLKIDHHAPDTVLFLALTLPAVLGGLPAQEPASTPVQSKLPVLEPARREQLVRAITAAVMDPPKATNSEDQATTARKTEAAKVAAQAIVDQPVGFIDLLADVVGWRESKKLPLQPAEIAQFDYCLSLMVGLRANREQICIPHDLNRSMVSLVLQDMEDGRVPLYGRCHAAGVLPSLTGPFLEAEAPRIVGRVSALLKRELTLAAQRKDQEGRRAPSFRDQVTLCGLIASSLGVFGDHALSALPTLIEAQQNPVDHRVVIPVIDALHQIVEKSDNATRAVLADAIEAGARTYTNENSRLRAERIVEALRVARK